VELIQNIRKSQSKLAEDKLKLLNIVDAYLITGTLPSQFRQSLLEDDDVAELYRINRAYVPYEIPERRSESTIAVMKERLQHLSEMSKEIGGIENDVIKELQKIHNELEQKEKDFLELENLILAEITEKICGQAAQPTI
jgi:hypothetical protein